MAKALKKPRKKVNGYKMPDPLPEGEILTGVNKKSWRLGKSIGTGGFGEIYLAQDASKSSSKYPLVIKVEPHGNGPLFVEMHFYMKNAKQADIETFMKKHKLKSFGMPVYLGSGSHEIGSTKFRFIVMERFGSDIDKLRLECKGALPTVTVFQVAWQITYVLEYIHELGYVHADIKGGNVLLGATPETKNQVYLLDFGLATKFTTDKEFKPNPKKAHDGTIEYLSRDAHLGVQTRRGDFEILAYNIIHWLGGRLPWESKLDEPKSVQTLKEDSMTDIPKFVHSCLKKNQDTIVKFLQYVTKLKFNEKPDYKKIRSFFEAEIKKHGGNVDGALEFSSTVRKRRSGGDIDLEENKTEEDTTEVKKPARKRGKKQESENEDETEEVMNDAMKEVLAKKTDSNKNKNKKPSKKPEKEQNRYTERTNGEVMTQAMKEVLEKKKEKDATKKKKKSGSKVNGELNKVDDFAGYNAEMIEVAQKMRNSPKREEEETRSGRSRRNVPVLNYDERTPKVVKRKQ